MSKSNKKRGQDTTVGTDALLRELGEIGHKILATSSSVDNFLGASRADKSGLQKLYDRVLVISADLCISEDDCYRLTSTSLGHNERRRLYSTLLERAS